MLVRLNHLENPDYPHELIGGLTNAVDLSLKLDCTYNYWGANVSGDALRIKERIFDIDKWNSFAAVDFNRFYTQSPVLLSPAAAALTSLTDVTSYVKTRLSEPYDNRKSLRILSACSCSYA